MPASTAASAPASQKNRFPNLRRPPLGRAQPPAAAPQTSSSFFSLAAWSSRRAGWPRSRLRPERLERVHRASAIVVRVEKLAPHREWSRRRRGCPSASRHSTEREHLDYNPVISAWKLVLEFGRVCSEKPSACHCALNLVARSHLVSQQNWNYTPNNHHEETPAFLPL